MRNIDTIINDIELLVSRKDIEQSKGCLLTGGTMGFFCLASGLNGPAENEPGRAVHIGIFF